MKRLPLSPSASAAAPDPSKRRAQTVRSGRGWSLWAVAASAAVSLSAVALWPAADVPAAPPGASPNGPVRNGADKPKPEKKPPAKADKGGKDADKKDDQDAKHEAYAELLKDAKEHKGLFKLHLKDDNLFLEILPEQFDTPYLLPISIARGPRLGGFMLNFEDDWVVVFRKVGEAVHVVRRNVRFKADPDTPEARAVETSYTDSVIAAVPIVATAPDDSSVVNLNDLLKADLADLKPVFGDPDPNRSSWVKVKAFPRNVEIEVAQTYSQPAGLMGGLGGGDPSVIDPRGTTLVVHYGLCKLPEDGYAPRVADDRVGHFLTAHQDFSKDGPDTNFVRLVNRWRLERADGPGGKLKGKLSPPKKRIVFWIEKSVPEEFRSVVREGILEWNKAFEKIGFRDAIEVRQQENEEFDPEDVNYSTFRWVTNNESFAMGPSRVNPLTGEIIDADIIFDASMVRYWQYEAQFFSTGGASAEPGAAAAAASAARIEAVRGPVQQMRDAWQPQHAGSTTAVREPTGALPAWIASNPAAVRRLSSMRRAGCLCAAHKRYELGLAAMVIAARGADAATAGAGAGAGGDGAKPEKDKGDGKPAKGGRLPDDLVLQAVKEVVMHEVGHTLGLRHNFKGSTFHRNEDLHNTALTRKVGLSGSVMDYNPVNLAPKGVKQGDYYSTTLGPYDYWAIEYAYRPLDGSSGESDDDADDLRKIASRCASAGLDYGTDEDMAGADPLCNAFDFGADPVRFAADRLAIVEEALKNLPERVTADGEGWQRTRTAFRVMLSQYADAAFLSAQFVAGESAHRDHRGDPKARDPLVPVPPARQRECLKLLRERILSDKAFRFPPSLLRRLAADRWMHWGNEGRVMSGTDFHLYGYILGIQEIALGRLMSPTVLARLQETALKADPEAKDAKDAPVTIAEVFRTLTDAVWSDLPGKDAAKDNKDAKDKSSAGLSVIRRNLQRSHLQHLCGLVLGGRRVFGPEAPADARALARMHLRDIGKRLAAVLTDGAVQLDETTRAHLEDCAERISKTLSAGLQLGEP